MEPRQLFGTVETVVGPAEAFVCSDLDRPNEVMFHWYSPNVKRAVLCTLQENRQGLKFTPTHLYYVSDIGALYLPRNITTEELNELKLTQGTLVRTLSGGLDGTWTNGSGQSGRIQLSVLPVNQFPRAFTADECKTWDEFKGWAHQIRSKHEGTWFRGHGCSKLPLMTSLMRTGRTRLERYCSAELAQFTAHAEAVLNQRLNLNDPNDYAIILGLARHHGLPTPMTDWTLSPYIAAFFAFSDVLDVSRLDSTHVRIYALSGKFLAMRSPSSVTVPHVRPYFVGIEISPVHNPRLYAQQGRFLVSNVADLETHIHIAETLSQEQHLFAADVPRECAVDALEDLSFMGLTAATMFPGLDGVGKMIRHRMSFKNPPLPPPTENPQIVKDTDAPLSDIQPAN
jgi:hypothetical protein